MIKRANLLIDKSVEVVLFKILTFYVGKKTLQESLFLIIIEMAVVPHCLFIIDKSAHITASPAFPAHLFWQFDLRDLNGAVAQFSILRLLPAVEAGLQLGSGGCRGA